MTERKRPSETSAEALVLFFGCWDRTGHGFHDTQGRPLHPPRDDCGPWGYKIDNGKLHPSAQAQGTRFLLHLDGWTALDVTDRSVDHRGGSHAAFLAPATLSEVEMVALALYAFPRICKRVGLDDDALLDALVEADEQRG